MTEFNQQEFGDYQTPINFARNVAAHVEQELPFSPHCVIEPTCGVGNFLVAATEKFSKSRFIGIEINERYLDACHQNLKNNTAKYELYQENVFDFKYDKFIKPEESVLFIGNPPWVTNSELTSLGSVNLPQKSNFKALRGLEAMTGSSNFDICEYIILDILQKCRGKQMAIAMLCKTSVAINVIKEIKRNDYNVCTCKIIKFDAKQVFNVSADACVLYITFGTESWNQKCQVYDLSEPHKMITEMGFVNGRFFTNLDNNSISIDGDSEFEWRQGVKHDCSKIMELTPKQGILYNALNEVVDIESDLVFPLIKSSRVRKFKEGNQPEKYVIVTQKKVGDTTSIIEDKYPKTWNYLVSNEQYFSARKSSIYINAPKFAMFGIGDYSFKPYKVAISGFYKKPVYTIIYGEKPYMLDDTCYFIGFDNYEEALISQLLLSSQAAINFLLSISNIDSKRPFTKKALSRLSFKNIAKTLDAGLNNPFPDNVSKDAWDEYSKKYFQSEQLSII